MFCLTATPAILPVKLENPPSYFLQLASADQPENLANPRIYGGGARFKVDPVY